MKENITIRNVSNLEEMKLITSWAKNEGWNIGKYDYDPYFELDKQGYLLLFLKKKPIGCISIVKYSQEFSFIGLFIVLPEYRSRGFGKKLWEEAMSRLHTIPRIGLYAVPKQVSRYASFGFEKKFKNQRFHQIAPTYPEDLNHWIDSKKSPHLMFEKLCQYDDWAFKNSRKKLLTRMLQMPQTFAFVSFDKNEIVTGYGLVRPCIKGFRIGPLYANDLESAQILFRLLLTKIPGKSIILDMPKNNYFGEIFAEYFNLKHVPETDTIAMFKGKKLEIKEKNNICYGIGSLELG